MKIKRFVAKDMRSALAAVRKEIGDDAVILSNKTLDEGVELMAAIDFDEETFNVDMLSQKESRHSERPQRDDHQAAGYREQLERSTANRPPVADESATIMEMRREMRALRRMMENELSGISWREMGHRRPESRELFRQLMNMGMAADIAERLMNVASDHDGFDSQWQTAMHYLAMELAVTDEDLAERGGIVAVVGPTGVGKTTSIAKLAARYCLRHGNRHVAMISTDNYRIGAREQLHTYGRILNVPVRTASNASELMETLNIFADKRFILIDTAGMGHQDVKLAEQLAMLEQAGRMVNRYLALSATTEQAALHRAVEAFGEIRPDACLVTKVDEAASLGSILSVIIKTGLPIAYYTDGQKVPEDMHVARANPLVDIASSLAMQTSEQLSDGYLAFALSDARSHAYL